MKILAYNISSCTQQKSETLFKQNADVYVVPEIAAEEEQFLPRDFEMKWKGIKYEKPFMGTKSKGLGIIWRKGHGKIPDWYDESLTYAIPLIYDGVLILGFWPTKLQKKEKYKDIAKKILEYYSSYFTSKTIITGDFNLFCKKDSQQHEADITQINDFLIEKGFISLYHKNRPAESFGSETTATYYHQFKETQPFFLDYTYANFPITSFKFTDMGRDFSDHVGQILEF